MDNEQLREEENYLSHTLSAAKDQMEQSFQTVEDLKDGIMEAKKEIRENAPHGIMNLNSSDDFEAVVELSQYMNPVRDQMVSLEEENKKIRRLEKIIKKPYFARIDFCFSLDKETEKVYIGRFPLSDQKADLRYVYDWRSPIAGVFYQFPKGAAFYEAPYGQIDGEVTLKRQYEIKGGKLEYYLDTDLNINDEILREALSQNASPKMKAIVETIQKEQDAVIRDLSSELLMVQGTAGSGKTSIALHRAAFLMYQDLKSHLTSDQILILSPNTAFEQYICQVLPELGEENVTTYTLEELLTQILKRGGIQTRTECYEKLMSESLRENMTSGRTPKTDSASGVFIGQIHDQLDEDFY